MKRIILFMLASVLTSTMNAEIFTTLKVGQGYGFSRKTLAAATYTISGNAITASSFFMGE